MNTSYSKKRSIQEANQKLEDRYLNENITQEKSELISYLESNGFHKWNPTGREKTLSDLRSRNLLKKNIYYTNKSNENDKDGAYLVTDGESVVFIDPYQGSKTYSLEYIKNKNMLKSEDGQRLSRLGSEEQLHHLVKQPEQVDN